MIKLTEKDFSPGLDSRKYLATAQHLLDLASVDNDRIVELEAYPPEMHLGEETFQPILESFNVAAGVLLDQVKPTSRKQDTVLRATELQQLNPESLLLASELQKLPYDTVRQIALTLYNTVCHHGYSPTTRLWVNTLYQRWGDFPGGATGFKELEINLGRMNIPLANIAEATSALKQVYEETQQKAAFQAMVYNLSILATNAGFSDFNHLRSALFVKEDSSTSQYPLTKLETRANTIFKVLCKEIPELVAQFNYPLSSYFEVASLVSGANKLQINPQESMHDVEAEGYEILRHYFAELLAQYDHFPEVDRDELINKIKFKFIGFLSVGSKAIDGVIEEHVISILPNLQAFTEGIEELGHAFYTTYCLIHGLDYHNRAAHEAFTEKFENELLAKAPSLAQKALERAGVHQNLPEGWFMTTYQSMKQRQLFFVIYEALQIPIEIGYYQLLAEETTHNKEFISPEQLVEYADYLANLPANQWGPQKVTDRYCQALGIAPSVAPSWRFARRLCDAYPSFTTVDYFLRDCETILGINPLALTNKEVREILRHKIQLLKEVLTLPA